jgi:gamma-D-glutamyl-L-lysine dipeptidyl-peptidase
MNRMAVPRLLPRGRRASRAALPLVLLLAAMPPACATRPAALQAPALAAASGADSVASAVEAVAAGVRARFAPDRRTARFDVTVARDGGNVVVTGETTSDSALASFRRELGQRGIAWQDRVLVLPDPALGERTWALANNSVANLRTTPGHSSELSTQVLLGMPLRVLRREDGGFFLVQAPDGYLSWVDGGGIHRVTEAELQRYRDAPKIIYTRTAGVASATPGTDAGPVADLVLGAVLEVAGGRPADGWYEARMPDGRRAFVPVADAVPYDAWTDSVSATGDGLVAVARKLMGAPYLWGGTSAKGMDCSGFTKTVYLMHGLILPRDASQQVHIGTLVDDAGDFSRLRPGDLLFFGRPAAGGAPERVVHVAMWIGDGRFIHASGRVMVNSMDAAAPDYDDHNRRRYLRTKRVLGSPVGVRPLRGGGLFAF